MSSFLVVVSPHLKTQAEKQKLLSSNMYACAYVIMTSVHSLNSHSFNIFSLINLFLISFRNMQCNMLLRL